jgi:trigger factor
MQVTETNTEGLRREFTVTVPASDIDQRIDTRLKEVGKQVRLPGFRPGKVPMPLLKKRFGRSVLGEIVEATVNETSQATMNDRGLRPAGQPKIEITQFDEGQDLEYKMEVEVLPEIEEVPTGDLELTRLQAEVSDEIIDEGVQRVAQQRPHFKAISGKRGAKQGDQVLISFTGYLDGEERAEMSGQDQPLTIGANQFIPGFEEQLVGAKAGENKTVELSFPDDYPSQEHAGKPARFEVEIKEIREPSDAPPDDEFAKELGFDDLAAMREAVRQQTEQQFTQASRQRMKRELLDKLHERVTFAVPESMVDMEFNQIWQQVEQALEHHRQHKDDPDHHHEHDPELDKPEDELRAEYRQIAERRVRLGLLLSEIGQRNNVQVEQDELNRAVVAEARKYPGQEQQVLEFFQQNPQALDNIRAPLYEEKVVDHLIEQATLTDKTVTPEELLADPDAEEAGATKPEETKSKATSGSKKASGGKAGANKAAASKSGDSKSASTKASSSRSGGTKASSSKSTASKSGGKAASGTAKSGSKAKTASKSGE